MKTILTTLLTTVLLVTTGCGGGASGGNAGSGDPGPGTGDATDGGDGGKGGEVRGSDNNNKKPGNNTEGDNCPQQLLEAVTGGCSITLRTPANCESISFTAEFAWYGDACHTPYYLQIAGTPVTDYNYKNITVNTDPINATAWAEPVDADSLSGLTSESGWYHWRICNAYESGCSATRAFRVE